jgi:hypothetical protein
MSEDKGILDVALRLAVASQAAEAAGAAVGPIVAAGMAKWGWNESMAPYMFNMLFDTAYKRILAKTLDATAVLDNPKPPTS